jgi:hypothetical protein
MNHVTQGRFSYDAVGLQEETNRFTYVALNPLTHLIIIHARL